MNLSYYKTIAPFYDLIVPRDINGICDSFEQFLVKHSRNEEILDLGCGTGRFAIALAKRGFKVTGLDTTEEMLKIAEQNTKKAKINIKYIKSDMRNFRLKKKIRFIWARGSIGDLTKIEDIKKALVNIRRNLSRNGLFIFDVRDYVDYLKKNPEGFACDTRTYKKKGIKIVFDFKSVLNKKTKIASIKDTVMIETPNNIKKSGGHHQFRYYTRADLKNLLTRTGYKIIKILPSYPLAKEDKPRLVVIAQNGD
jgi:ubiquinone/menaquinone biosynthesis C-methylase UbiE